MKTRILYATCSDAIATLSNIGYVPAGYQGMTLPSKTVRFIMEYGGGKPTVYHYARGTCSACGGKHYAEREIIRPARPSNHKCGGKCRSAKGPNCECACGGEQHGAGY